MIMTSYTSRFEQDSTIDNRQSASFRFETELPPEMPRSISQRYVTSPTEARTRPQHRFVINGKSLPRHQQLRHDSWRNYVSEAAGKSPIVTCNCHGDVTRTEIYDVKCPPPPSPVATPVTIKSEKTPPQQQRAPSCGKCQIAIGAILVAILITCSLLIFFYVTNRDSSTRLQQQDSKKPTLSSTMENGVIFTSCNQSMTSSSLVETRCHDKECHVRLGQMLSKMNLSADPCQDFYEYACGDWMKSVQIPSTRQEVGASSDVIVSTDDALFNLLNSAGRRENFRSNSNETEAEVKMRIFLYSCCDLKRNSTPLIKLLNETFGGWIESGPRKFDLDYQITKCVLYDLGCFFSIDVSPSYNKKRTYVIKIAYKDVLTLPPALYAPPNKFYEHKMKSFMKEVFELLQVSNADDVIDEIFAFEKSLATIIPPNTNIFVENFTETTIRQLTEIAPEVCVINFTRYDDVTTSRHRSNGYRLIKENYVSWRVIFSFAYQVSYNFRQIYQKYTIYNQQTLMEECLSLVKKHFKIPLGIMYSRKYFLPQMKVEVEAISNSVKLSANEMVKRNRWLNEKSRSFLFKQLKSLQINIGYNDLYMKDSKALNDLYKFPVLENEFFINFITTVREDKLTRIDELTDENSSIQKWPQAYYSTSALYCRDRNSIFIPAAFLQAPFYDQKASKAANYGSVGNSIAHEISHAFDALSGLTNEEKWYEDFNNEFSQRAECVVSHYEENGLVNGEKTLFENIADINGVLLSYAAFEKQLSPKKTDLETNIDKKSFFINFAHTFCSKKRSSYTRSDEKHAPEYYRVVTTLSNIKEFSAAFQCEKGRRMNRRKKCVIW